MLVGVGEGSATGICPVEMLDLAKIIDPYIGPSGPKWDIQWVPVSGTKSRVIMILVDPSKYGQAPFPCCANEDGVNDGRIYIRAEGQTREVRSGEFDFLMTRSNATSSPTAEVSVEILGDISALSCDESRTLEEYLDKTRTHLLRPLKTAAKRGENSTLKLIGGDAHAASQLARLSLPEGNYRKAHSEHKKLLKELEKRSPEEYLENIEKWEDEFRASWNVSLLRIASSRITPAIVRLENLTKSFLKGVELKVQLKGPSLSLGYTNPEWIRGPSDLDLPSPPRIWGPGLKSFGSDSIIPSSASFIRVLPACSPSPSITYNNDEPVTLRILIDELRP